MNTANSSPSVVGKSACLVGAGAIGSWLVPLLARMRELARVTIVDCDSYEEKNVASQAISRRDVGRAKARVQAVRLRRLNPRIQVEALHERVESVPLAKLRADVLLGCLDSRAARQALSEAAGRLGVPLVDAGVHADAMLARVDVYVPGPDAPCMQCAWEERDYAALEQRFECETGAPIEYATNAPAALGALAAAVQAIECRRMLGGDGDRALAGWQVVVDAATHKQFVTTFRRNPRCRFDHRTLTIEKVMAGPSDVTLRQAFALGGFEPANGTTLSACGRRFVGALACPACGRERRILRLSGRLRPADLACAGCGKTMRPVGFETRDRLAVANLGAPVLRRPLAALGFRGGDIFSVTSGDEQRDFELAANHRRKNHD